MFIKFSFAKWHTKFGGRKACQNCSYIPWIIACRLPKIAKVPKITNTCHLSPADWSKNKNIFPGSVIIHKCISYCCLIINCSHLDLTLMLMLWLYFGSGALHSQPQSAQRIITLCTNVFSSNETATCKDL